MDGDIFWVLLPLLALGLVIAFPIFVIIRLASLTREIRDLKVSLYGADIRGPLPARPVAAPALEPAPAMTPGFDLGRAPQPKTVPPPILATKQPVGPLPLTRVPPPAPIPIQRARPALVTLHTPAMSQVPTPTEAKRFDLEAVIGANWLAKLGVAAIVLAAAFFLQYAFANGLIGQTARVAIGLVASAAMIGIGEVLIVKDRYRNWAQVVISGGIMVYFLSIYAGYNLYHLMGYTTAFGAFAAAAAAASVLAIVNNSQSVAVLCVLGAFLAPVLIREGGELASLTRLYVYLAVINVWVLAVMRMRPWHLLAGVSFLCTWSIFFFAGHFRGEGWLVEAFAGLFLLFSIVSGVGLMRLIPEKAAGGADLTQAGVSLILGACIAFSAASAAVLAGWGMLGLPDLMLAGVLTSLVLAGLAAGLPPLPNNDSMVRRTFGYLAAAALSVVLLGSLSSAEPTRQSEVPLAFGFAVVNYVLFLATANVLRRRTEGDAPAAVLIGANAVIHTSMILHVLAHSQLLDFPAATMWLPVAALVTLAWMAITCRGETLQPFYRLALIGAAMGLPVLALFGGVGQTAVRSHGALQVFTAEFVAVSLGWLVLRSVTARAPFKVDLLAAFVNAAVFFGLMAQAVGGEHIQGVSILAAAAIGMSAYHAAVGSSLFQDRTDTLVKLGYLGIALTFVTIAIPLQLEASYITVAWAAEAAALLWTASATGERKVQWYGFALMAVAAAKAFAVDLFVRPEYPMLFLNTRMLAGAAVIAAAAFGAWTLNHRVERKSEDAVASTSLVALANAFLLTWVSVDLWDYVGRIWSVATRGQAQQLTLSLFWTVYALVVVSFGIGLRTRAVRIFGMGLLYLCIVKVFLLDLAGLDQPFRILSFLTLGIILLLVSLLYTRFEQRLGEQPVGALEPMDTPAILGAQVREQEHRRAS